MIEARDRSYKHSTPTTAAAGAGALALLCGTWVFVCQCVRQLDSGRVCLRAFVRQSARGKEEDRRSRRSPVVIIPGTELCPRAAASLHSHFFSCSPPELCLRARQCASTPWPTSVWSSTGLLPTRRGLTTSGWHIQERSPTHDLAP